LSHRTMPLASFSVSSALLCCPKLSSRPTPKNPRSGDWEGVERSRGSAPLPCRHEAFLVSTVGGS